MKIKAFLAAATLMAVASTSQAAVSPNTVAQYAKALLERGHGGYCGLDAKPVTGAGYYRCLDAGPYRFIQEYMSLKGYVKLGDGTPFLVYASDDSARTAQFLFQGAWVDDMAVELANYERNLAKPSANGEALRQQAEKAVQEYHKPPATPAAPPKTGEQAQPK
jgi:hypothetical protein